MSSANDFDFLIGSWSVHHRRLNRRLAGDTTWIEFTGPATARKILGGLGNFDEIDIALPSGPANECRWEQAFSDDGGQSWETNWTMAFTRQV